MKKYLSYIFALLSATAISAEKVLDEWQIRTLPNLICSEQFFLQTGAELEKNPDSFSGMTANAGGSSHSNIGFQWGHLNFQKNTLYKLIIRHKGNGWSGAYLIPKNSSEKRLSVSLRKAADADGWNLTESKPFDPAKFDSYIAYGDESLKFDCAYFVPENQNISDNIPQKTWITTGKSPDWKTINISAGKDAVYSFGRVGCVLMKQELDFGNAICNDGTYFLKLGIPEDKQKINVFFNGKQLEEIDGYLFAIPASLIRQGSENILAALILASPSGRRPWQQKGPVIKGSVTLSDKQSFPLPQWAEIKTDVIEKAAENIRIMAIMENDPASSNLQKIRLITVKNGFIELGYSPELNLAGMRIPLALDMKSGEYFSWLGKTESAGKELNISIAETTIELCKFKELIENTGNCNVLKNGKLITGVYITPVLNKDASQEEKNKHYQELFSRLENAGINTLIVNGISDPIQLNIIKEKSLKYGTGIIYYPLNNGQKIDYENPGQTVPVFKEIVKEWSSFPNLTAYGISDEISMKEARTWSFSRMIMEALDSRHPTTVILNMNHFRQTQVLGARVLHRDIYYGMPGFDREVCEAGKIADKLNIPLWVTLASGLPENDLRLQIWLSIADGARGLFFFHGYASLYPKGSKYDGIFDRKTLEARYQAKVIKDIGEKIQKLPNILNSRRTETNMVKSDNPQIMIKTRIAPGGSIYLFAINLNTGNEAAVSITSTQDYELTACTANTAAVQGSDKSMRVSLAPGDCRIYRMVRRLPPNQ